VQVEKAREKVDAAIEHLREDVADPLKRLARKDIDLARELDGVIRRDRDGIQMAIEDERKTVQDAYLWLDQYTDDLDEAYAESQRECAHLLQSENQSIRAMEEMRKALAALTAAKKAPPDAVAKPSKDRERLLAEIEVSAERLQALLEELAALRQHEETKRKTEGKVVAVSARGNIEITLGTNHGLAYGHEVALFRNSGDEVVKLGTAIVKLVRADRAVAAIATAALAREVKVGDRVRILIREKKPE